MMQLIFMLNFVIFFFSNPSYWSSHTSWIWHKITELLSIAIYIWFSLRSLLVALSWASEMSSIGFLVTGQLETAWIFKYKLTMNMISGKARSTKYSLWSYSLWPSCVATSWTSDLIECGCSDMWKWLLMLSYLYKSVTSLYSNHSKTLVDNLSYLSSYMFFKCCCSPVMNRLNHQSALYKKSPLVSLIKYCKLSPAGGWPRPLIFDVKW